MDSIEAIAFALRRVRRHRRSVACHIKRSLSRPGGQPQSNLDSLARHDAAIEALRALRERLAQESQP